MNTVEKFMEENKHLTPYEMAEKISEVKCTHTCRINTYVMEVPELNLEATVDIIYYPEDAEQYFEVKEVWIDGEKVEITPEIEALIEALWDVH